MEPAMNQKYDIGQTVKFQNAGETHSGRVFGTELVDDSRRRKGWHYTIHAGPLELVRVHEKQIAGVQEEQAAR